MHKNLCTKWICIRLIAAFSTLFFIHKNLNFIMDGMLLFDVYYGFLSFSTQSWWIKGFRLCIFLFEWIIAGKWTIAHSKMTCDLVNVLFLVSMKINVKILHIYSGKWHEYEHSYQDKIAILRTSLMPHNSVTNQNMNMSETWEEKLV